MDFCAAWSGYGPMRGTFSIVVLVALAVLLDSTLNDGFFTRAVTEMFSDISVHFN
jgi:excisionase family DNA binding protein